jgi:long-chain acyl-CoA synthetase
MLAALTAPDSQFALVRETIRGTTFTAFRAPPRNLAHLYALAEAFDDRDFLVYDDQRLSYRQARHAAWCLAARLVDDFEVGKGDRIVLAMRNYPEWCISYMAATSIGAVIAPLNAWWQGRELDYAVRDTGARVAIVDQERLERLEPYLSGLGVRVIVARPASEPSAGIVDIASLLDGYAQQPGIDVHPDDDAMLLYTSGSTALPKAVLSTHRAVISSVIGREVHLLSSVMPLLDDAWRRDILEWATRGRDAHPAPLTPQMPAAVLVAAPLFHVTACSSLFLTAFRIGSKLVLMNKWSPAQALELVERERITSFTGVPAMCADLINSPDFTGRDTSSLTVVVSAGAARPAAQVGELTRRAAGLVSAGGYGMTETNAMGASIFGQPYTERPDCAGRAQVPLVELKVVGPEGNALEPGQEGEICIKSVSNMRGYWNDPEATARVLRDGWMHTGDLGYLNPEGYLYITGRTKNIVIRGGEKISCGEVEKVLYDHSAVLEAAVYAVPDERLGELVAATVMHREGQAATADELQAHVAARLAKYKVPSHIEVQNDPLPRLASGKFDISALKTRAAAALRRHAGN